MKQVSENQPESNATFKTYISSPIGMIEISGSEEGISGLYFIDNEIPVKPKRTPPLLRDCVVQLEEYFNGKRKVFGLSLDLQGTPFQVRVWEELLRIPFGRTISYRELTARLGDPKAIRAVGRANGQNPVSVIVPCHRVVGSDGSLTGYGGGLWRKEWLLRHEGIFVQGKLDLFS